MRARRVLHVIGALTYGGIERWLLRVLAQFERRTIACDVLTLFAEPAPLDAEAERLGVRVLRCPGYRRPWQFAPRFLRLLHRHGPYDVIHCHLQEYSGFVLALAQLAGVPLRIAHSHSDLSERHATARLPARLYRRGLRALLSRSATVRLAVSGPAAASLFGPTATWRYLPCGIELELFANAPPRAVARAALGLASDPLVVGHVGRFVPVKNHSLLVASFAELHARHPPSHLVLVGDGPLRPTVEAQVAALGLGAAVTFTGSRPDVPTLLAACDLLALPSRYEGLGVVAVEAQALGLPCVLSNVIPSEATIIPSLVRRVDLHAPPAHWASALLEAARMVERLPPAAARELIRPSPFNLAYGVTVLSDLYWSGATR